MEQLIDLRLLAEMCEDNPHHWVDVRNEVIVRLELCLRCGAIR